MILTVLVLVWRGVQALTRTELILDHVMTTLNRSVDPCESFSRFVCTEHVFEPLRDGSQPSRIDYLYHASQFTVGVQFLQAVHD